MNRNENMVGDMLKQNRVARDREIWEKSGPGIAETWKTGIGIGTGIPSRDRDRESGKIGNF